MSLSVETYALSKKYTNDSISGISGALAGKNCTIQSITEIEGGHRVTFQWTADNGTVRTQTMDVMDGSGAEAIEQIYADNGVLGAKNLLENTANNKSSGNVDFTVNADKTITVNTTGTVSAVQTLAIGEVKGLQGNYILNGVTGGSQSTYGIQLYDVTTSTWITQYATDGDSVISLADGTHTYRFVLYVRNGATVSGGVVKPMLRLASDTDSTYVPYAMTNKELTESKMTYADNGVLGAKNLLPNKATTQTINGVTFTVNSDDGSITANGTASATAFLPIVPNNTMTIKKGSYILSAGDGIIDNYSKYGLYINDASGDIANTKIEERTHFALSADILVNECKIFVTSGTTVSNLTFYPMLRLASDPDDTYVPYAMTNRELTENANGLINHYPDYAWNRNKVIATSGANLNDITTPGLYKCQTGSIASTLVNCPVTVAFGLEVIIGNDTNSFIIQIIKYTSNSNEVYMRTYSSNSWTSWYKFTGTEVS